MKWVKRILVVIAAITAILGGLYVMFDSVYGGSDAYHAGVTVAVIGAVSLLGALGADVVIKEVVEYLRATRYRRRVGRILSPALAR